MGFFGSWVYDGNAWATYESDRQLAGRGARVLTPQIR
jgi:hypothetical protein